jgi:nicotinamide mononucleotide transporter
MTVDQFIAGFLGASLIEIIASVSGFICVLLIIKRSIWNWVFGLVQVSLFAWVFFHYKLYSDAMLHVIYIGLQFYGFWNWWQHKNQQNELIIEKTKGTDIFLCAIVCVVSAFVLGTVMNTYTDAEFAYADAFTSCTSLVAQFLLSRRHLFNWSFWIVVDVVAIGIYAQKGLYPTSLLYFTFLIMACIGQWTWWKQYKTQTVK